MAKNYQPELDELINSLKKEGINPSLLLHCCCAPCSSYVLEYLSNFFKITAFYYNPNTRPESEFELRRSELIRLINEMEFYSPVDLICEEYSSDDFLLATAGLEKEKEGGARCEICYYLRLKKTAEFAKKNNYDYFCTTLSVSPYKNAQKLNDIGKKLEHEYNVKYLVSDFKKKDGYKRSIELSRKYNLYRQIYCGCSKDAGIIL